MLRADPLEQGLGAASLVMLSMHATDLPFFDSRLNILGWVLSVRADGFLEAAPVTAPLPAPDRDAPSVSRESEDP